LPKDTYITAEVFGSVLNSHRIIGSYVGNRQDSIEALKLAAAGDVSTTYTIEKLDNLPSVFKRMAAGKLAGRIVLDCECSEGGYRQDDVEERECDDAEDEVRPGRRNTRVVEEAAFSSDGEADVDAVEEEKVFEDEEEGTPNGSNEDEPGIHVSDVVRGEHDVRGNNDGDEAIKEDEDDEEDTLSRATSRKVKREQWFENDESGEEEAQPNPDATFPRNEEDRGDQRRPRKRARGRQVRIVDEGDSDDEEEQMERSIIAANSGYAHEDEDADEDDASGSQLRRVHLYDEEDDERHEFGDAFQEDDAPDYPDEGEENDFEEEEDNY
ncbi:hypothetical protein F442_00571, partial [Phytophthora nicotianae P10297]